ncbi:hypothetical protein [Isoptericola sp. NPDC056134]|uniref:hypothetical protein n=1 Tax=Isoptericola sp. NPDC056134 TaxID=3345723 RepID=UPI0035E601EE
MVLPQNAKTVKPVHSDNGYRHFQDLGTGQVISVSAPRMIAIYANSPDDYREIQAVAKDAYVIDGPLPTVTETVDDRGTWYRAAAGKPQGPARITIGTALHTAGAEDMVEHAERRVKEFAALVAYFREHPPVEVAQVKAIRKAYQRAYPQSGGLDQPGARRLYGEGVRVEGATS